MRNECIFGAYLDIQDKTIDIKLAVTFRRLIYLDTVSISNTVEPQWFEHLWDHGNLFETWAVRATEG